MEYSIRNCERTDLSQLVVLCQKHAEFEKAEFVPEGKATSLEKAIFAENPKLYCLVVATKETIIGYVSYTIDYSTWDAAEFIHMDCLFLEEQARSFGIGAILIGKLQQIGREKNCINIQWQTPQFNERAIKFYHRIGGKGKDKVRFTLNL
ncbi:MAG: GNAT family N-acetyltransferase [Flavobacterium circumlabens]|uniref:GNAT family N-acetyltransferase n=1 Tax=Flavobacterium circumlabens TaxID=2133765 RepID=A0A4Y7U7F5_9FLAO|nr:GNAT family N-acetyltransferase [Flavobacterium circumlabens]TCN61311.1 ribosomal protein S18 acetylase RimI-like enzyme [Flavobacterium circumlabens]TEB42184.1 GNAT family N-acetyltransferase [Flavobacterium circumlabens]